MLEKPTLRKTWLPLGVAALVLVILNFGLYTRLAPSQAESVTLELPYYADYTDSNALNLYVPFGGDWAVRDQMIVQLSPSGYDLGTVIPLQIPIDQPYLFETSIRYFDGDHGGGILFNAQQPGTRQKSHMARFNTADDGTWWLIYGYFDDGSAFIGQGSVQLDGMPRDPAPHTLGVQVSGAVYTLLVDNQPVVTDMTLQYQGGAVGLITAAAQVGFSNVRVEALTAETTALPESASATAEAVTQIETPTASDPALNETALYTTNFTEEGTASRWLPLSGAWVTETGAMVQTQPEGFDLSTLLNLPFSPPYTLSVTLRHREGTGGGVLFNIPDPASNAGGTMVRYFEDGTVLAWGYFDSSGAFNGQGSASVTAPGTDAHILEVAVSTDSYSVRLDGSVVVEAVPLNLPNTTGYVGITASQSITAFEQVSVSGHTAAVPSEAVTLTSGIDAALATGDWRVEGSAVIQSAVELTDYFVGTGVAAENFTLSADILLPADNVQAGGGLVFHMQGQNDPGGGAMVRFGSGGSEIFWGEYNADGVFVGAGASALTATPDEPVTLAIIVRGQAYDVRVNDTLIAENLPIGRLEGWIGLISFSGPVTFSNIQLTMGGA